MMKVRIAGGWKSKGAQRGIDSGWIGRFSEIC